MVLNIDDSQLLILCYQNWTCPLVPIYKPKTFVEMFCYLANSLWWICLLSQQKVVCLWVQSYDWLKFKKNNSSNFFIFAIFPVDEPIRFFSFGVTEGHPTKAGNTAGFLSNTEAFYGWMPILAPPLTFLGFEPWTSWQAQRPYLLDHGCSLDWGFKKTSLYSRWQLMTFFDYCLPMPFMYSWKLPKGVYKTMQRCI